MGFFEWFDKCLPLAKFRLFTLSSSGCMGSLHAFSFLFYFVFFLIWLLFRIICPLERQLLQLCCSLSMFWRTSFSEGSDFLTSFSEGSDFFVSAKADIALSRGDYCPDCSTINLGKEQLFPLLVLMFPCKAENAHTAPLLAELCLLPFSWCHREAKHNRTGLSGSYPQEAPFPPYPAFGKLGQSSAA